MELLHARLAILDKDPRSGQPFRSNDGRYVLAFNGEIYNYLELRRALDYPFRTESDTEVICAAFERHGETALRMFKGTFALAIADTVEKTILLARDAVGKKPLFVANWNGQCLFGSSLLALASVAAVPAELNAEELTDYWVNGFVNPSTSLLAGARPVLPGEAVLIRWNGHRGVTRMSFADFASETEDESDEAGADETEREVLKLLGESVDSRMKCSPTPIVMLSGGIDSTAVASRVAKLRAKGAPRNRAVTLGSFAPMLNDEFFARYAASRLEFDLRTVRIRTRTLSSDVMWALDLQDEPLADVGFFTLACLIRSVSSVGRVVLTGDGGDEIFGGYANESRWASLGERAGAEVASRPEVYVGAGPAKWMTPWARETVTNRLVGHAMVKLDRSASEQGVEARCPLLDRALIRRVRRLPPGVLFRSGRSKAILRDELASWPGWFLNRPKRGLTYNLRWQWLLTRFEGLREGISSDALGAVAPLLPPALRGDPARWKSRDVMRHFAECWKILSLSQFMERCRTAQRGGWVSPLRIDQQSVGAGEITVV